MILKHKWLWLLVLLFTLSRIINLTILPIFADEAIYIRWGQLFGREPIKYLFFPLYDGKTPLFIWLLGIIGKTNSDPLFSGRILSVFAGLATGFVISKLAELVSQQKKVFYMAFVVWMCLPFSYIYSRLALIDMLLTLWLAISTYYFFKSLLQPKSPKWMLILPGMFWGLALITKTSAFYYLPVYAALFLFYGLNNRNSNFIRKTFIGMFGFILGGSLLGIMRISPLFPFLFQRGADFTFSIHDILSDLPHILLTNLHRVGKWLLVYCSPLIILFVGFLKPKKTEYSWLLIGFVVWLLPFMITGKVLSSRYILPCLIFVVPMLAIAINRLTPWISRLVLVLLIGYGMYWGYFLVFNPDAAPYPIEDRVQFLTDWSSGHGIKPVADYFLELAKSQKLLIATEGYFGTLPDGLMIYLDGKPELDNMRVEGVGLPIFGVPKLLIETQGYDRKFIVVNEHRFVGTPLPPGLVLVEQFKRPHNGPSLLLLEYTENTIVSNLGVNSDSSNP